MLVTIQALFGIPFRHRCSAYLFGIPVRHRCSAYTFRHTPLVQNPYQNWSLCPVVQHTCSAYLVGIGVRHTLFSLSPESLGSKASHSHICNGSWVGALAPAIGWSWRGSNGRSPSKDWSLRGGGSTASFSLVAPWLLGRVPNSEQSCVHQMFALLDALVAPGSTRRHPKAFRVRRMSVQK